MFGSLNASTKWPHLGHDDDIKAVVVLEQPSSSAEEVDTNSSLDVKTSDVSTSPRSMSDKVDNSIADHNKWTVITSKCRRKGFTPKNLIELDNTYSYYLTTANRYKQLTNLRDMSEKDITSMDQDENNIYYYISLIGTIE
jgi:hypothetical protein